MERQIYKSIRGGHQSLGEYLKSVFEARNLILSFAVRDLKIQYAQTYLGIFWSLVQPLTGLIIFNFFFQRVIHLSLQVPYAVFAFTGIMGWFYFTALVGQAGTSLMNNQALIKKIQFPRLVLPLSKALVGLVEFSISLLLLLIMLLVFGIGISPKIIFLPLVVIANVVTGLSVGIWLSALTIRFRDLHHLIPYLIGFGIWLTPVFYPTTMVPEAYKWIYYLHPVANVIALYRWIFIGLPVDLWQVACSFTVALLVFISGLYFFVRNEKFVADYLLYKEFMAEEEIMLEVKNISKGFRLRENQADSFKGVLAGLFSSKKQSTQNFEALKNVSFNLHKGEALGIIGKNGAGKSTLLRILSGISQPDEGEINFYGKAVSILDIGAGFHPELTGRENIYLSASLYKFTRQKIEERFAEIVDFSGIGKFIDEPVKNYSSGMYLRLAFSIITCLDAEIYLIDEVVNVGDANFQMKCKGKIEELIAAGKTLLIASHNMNEISILCNRIILMEYGQIIETGGADIIQKYMTIALPQYFNFEGNEFYHVKNLSESPFDQRKVSIDKYGIKDYKVNSEGISTNHPFAVFLDIELKEEINIELRLKFYDATGALIFTCSSWQEGAMKVEQPGKYHMEFHVPSNLFNTRFYSVELRVINRDYQSLMFKADKFISLKMSDDNMVADHARELTLQGLIKPLIPVSITPLT